MDMNMVTNLTFCTCACSTRLSEGLLSDAERDPLATSKSIVKVVK